MSSICCINCVKSLFSVKEEDFSWITEQSADSSNDFLLAQHLQHQFDQEHDQLLKLEEDKLNGPSKGGFFSSKFGCRGAFIFLILNSVLSLLRLCGDVQTSSIDFEKPGKVRERFSVLEKSLNFVMPFKIAGMQRILGKNQQIF